MPRLDFWQRVLNAIISGNLEVRCPPDVPGMPKWRDWLIGIWHAVNRHNDPSVGARQLKLISVSAVQFKAWADNESLPRRGPPPGENNYRRADAKLFPEITRLIRSGRARSPYGAAMLVMERKGVAAVAGYGSRENKAKRISALYRRTHTVRRNP